MQVWYIQHTTTENGGLKMEIEEGRFGYRMALPHNHTSRLISIYGALPRPEDAGYDQFDRFMWQLIELGSKNRSPITLVIDSPGGDVGTFEVLLDHIRLLSCPVRTVARSAYSAAGLLLVSGEKGGRYVFEHSKIMLHQAEPDYDCPGHGWWIFKHYHTEEALEPARKERLARLNHRIARLLDECTEGKILNRLGDWSNVSDEEQRAQGILTLLKNGVWLNAKEALEYGVADHIINREDFQSLFR